MSNPASFPSTLTAQVYPANSPTPYPEFDSSQTDQSARYKQPAGLAFSGGGPRAFSAALGQMRGLYNIGFLDIVGAISCVSGGTWFGTLFNYAPNSISDSELLGPVIDPGDITLNNINSIDSNCIGSPLLALTNSQIARWLGVYYAEYQLGWLPFNRIYSRVLNSILLGPFNLNSTYTFFSLDEAAIQNILKNNPNLTQSNFYPVRPDRPYFIAGATQIYPTDENEVMRHFEYTPLYVGTPQLFSGEGQDGADIGGGFVQSFAFDSATPTVVPNATNLVRVPTPSEYFLLSDMMGSSGAAPASVLDCISLANLFPEFQYWPAVNLGDEAAVTYSFADGGDFENTGIVSLLGRQYRAIIAFVNTSLPIGSPDDQCYNGIDGQISRLFGLMPPCDPSHSPPCTISFCPQQNLQVFPSAQFPALENALKSRKAQGQPPFFQDFYTVVPDNPFNIPSYDVTVLWFYNDINLEWKNQLSSTIQALLASTSPTNRFTNFPNYATVAQNKASDGFWELLLLTAEQINLLANMWCYTIMTAGGEAVRSLRNKLT